MKVFLSFVKKEFFHVLRDPKTLLILMGMPIVQIILFGFALTNEVKNSGMAIWDKDNTIASQKLTEQLSNSKYFDLIKTIHNPDEIEKTFKKGRVKIIVVIPAHFEEDIQHFHDSKVQFIADATDPNVASTVTNYASIILGKFTDDNMLSKKMPYTISTETRMLYNPQLRSVFAFVPGIMAIILMLVCTMMTSLTIVKEKEVGTMEVLLVSPLKPVFIIIAKVVPYLLVSIINIASILLLSVFVFDLPIRGSLTLVIGCSILYALVSLALGLLFSTVTNSQQMAMILSLLAIFLPTVILCGFLFPIENMPLPLQILSKILPASWYYRMIKIVMIQGLPIKFIIKELIVLSGMASVLFVLALKRFKIRLE